MQIGRLRHPSIHPQRPRQQDHGSMNAHILNNLHARQKPNEKMAFDLMKKKVKLKWDEFQTQVQQIE
jgi:hypothetical protein